MEHARALARDRRYVEACDVYRAALAGRPDDADALFELGSVLFRAGDRDEAVARMEESLRLGRDGRDVRETLAALYHARGDDDAWAEALRRAAELDPDDAQLNLQAGRAFLACGRYAEALPELDAALCKGIDGKEIRLDRTRVLSELGRFADAAGEVRQAISFLPDDRALRLELGTLLMKTGERSAAVRAYEDALASGCTDVRVFRDLAQLLAEEGGRERARVLLAEAVRVHPDDPELHWALGRILLHGERDYPAAVDALTRALEHGCEDRNLRRDLACAREAAGDRRGAAEELRRAMEAYPDDHGLHWDLAKMHLEHGDQDAAEAAYGEAMRRGAGNARMCSDLGWLCFRKGAYERAGKAFLRALELEPDNAEYLSALGKVRLAQGDHSGAAAVFERLLTVVPGDREAGTALVRSLVESGRCDEAVSRLREMLDRAPEDGGLYEELGRVCRRIGDDTEAVAAFRRAADLLGESALNEKDLVWLYSRLGDRTKAAELLRRAAEREPENGEPNAGLARLHHESGDYEAAVREFERARSKGYETVETVSELGRVHIYGRQDYAAGIRELELALSKGYDDKGIRVALAHAFDRTGDRGRAAEELGRAMAHDPDDRTLHWELAKLHVKYGAYDAAGAAFDEAIRRGCDDARLHCDRGWLFFRKGEYERAGESFLRALQLDPGNHEYLLALGKVSLYGTEDYRGAAEAFGAVFERDPENRDAGVELARSFREAGDYRAALGVIDGMLQRRPDDGGLYRERGTVHRVRGRFADAARDYRRAVELGFISAEMYKDLGWMQYDAGDHDAAIAAFRKAEDLDPTDGSFNAGIARVLAYHTRDYAAAVAELESARSKGYEVAETAADLGRLYREQNDFVSSAAVFERVLAMPECREDAVFANRMKGELELSRRKLVLSAKPGYLTLTLTTRCNINCVMCEVRRAWKRHWDLPERTLREVMALFPTLEHVTLSGGEVFLYRHFADYFDEALKYPRMRQEITTNGLMIDEAWAERLARSNLMLVYSIDGFSRESYERIRRGGRYEDLLRSIRLVNRYRERYDRTFPNGKKMELALNFVVMRSNLSELERIVDFAVEHRFSEIRLAEIKFATGAENVFLHNDAAALGYLKRIMPGLLRKAERHGIFVRTWFMNLDFYDAPADGCAGGPACGGAESLGPEPESGFFEDPLPDEGPGVCVSDSPEDADDVDCNNPEYMYNNNGCPAEKEIETIPPAADVSETIDDGFMCYLPWRELYVDPGGGVKYQCFCNLQIGNVGEDSLMRIWNGAAMQTVRKMILEHRCAGVCDERCLSGQLSGELLGRLFDQRLKR